MFRHGAEIVGDAAEPAEAARIGHRVQPAGPGELVERRLRGVRQGAHDPLAQHAHPAGHPEGGRAGLDRQAGAAGERDKGGRADAGGRQRHVDPVDLPVRHDVRARLRQRLDVADHRELDRDIAGEQHGRSPAIGGIHQAGGASLQPGERLVLAVHEFPGPGDSELRYRNPAALDESEQELGPVEVFALYGRVELGGDPARRQSLPERPVEGEPGPGRRPLDEGLRERVLREDGQVRGRHDRGPDPERPPQQDPQLHDHAPGGIGRAGRPYNAGGRATSVLTAHRLRRTLPQIPPQEARHGDR